MLIVISRRVGLSDSHIDVRSHRRIVGPVSNTVPDGDVRDGPCAVVTLVPGTWSGKAAWTKADSPLHSALTKAGCKVVAFKWSRSNSFQARMRAARQLDEQLRDQIKEDPDARQWIVAHSHGGNIALHAVRLLRQSSPDAPRVSTVTLATPFIHARPRAISGWSVFLLALFSPMMIALASTTLKRASWCDLDFYVAALALVVLLLGIIGAGMHWGFLQRVDSIRAPWRSGIDGLLWWPRVIDALQRGKFIRPGYRSQMIASVHSPKVGPQDVFVIRAAGDEASTGLATGQFLGWISARLNPLLTHLWVWVVLIGATNAAGALTAAIGLDAEIFVFMINTFAVVGLVAEGVLLAMLAAAVPFGWDGPFVSIFASCSAEAAPPGHATVLQLEPFVGAEKRGLAHSRLYRIESVISEIVTLICMPSSIKTPVVAPQPRSGHPTPQTPNRGRGRGRKSRS